MPALVLGLLMLLFTGWLAHEPVLFVARGVGVVAEVVVYEGSTACRGRGARRDCHHHQVRLPSGEILRFDLGNPVPLGATLEVTWVPGRPDLAEPTALTGPWWTDLWQRLSVFALPAAALGLFWTLWGVVGLRVRRRRP